MVSAARNRDGGGLPRAPRRRLLRVRIRDYQGWTRSKRSRSDPTQRETGRLFPIVLLFAPRSPRCWLARRYTVSPLRRRGMTSGGAGSFSDVQGDGGKGRRRPALTPEAIVAAAIRIADDDGLEAVSIRRIASEIDARPMSLYDHFVNKDALLAAMADEVVGEVLVDPPLPDGWREALAAISRQLYAMLVRHPWLVVVTSKHPRFGPNSEKQAAQFAEAMSGLAAGLGRDVGPGRDGQRLRPRALAARGDDPQARGPRGRDRRARDRGDPGAASLPGLPPDPGLDRALRGGARGRPRRHRTAAPAYFRASASAWP